MLNIYWIFLKWNVSWKILKMWPNIDCYSVIFNSEMRLHYPLNLEKRGCKGNLYHGSETFIVNFGFVSWRIYVLRNSISERNYDLTFFLNMKISISGGTFRLTVDQHLVFRWYSCGQRSVLWTNLTWITDTFFSHIAQVHTCSQTNCVLNHCEWVQIMYQVPVRYIKL